MTTKEHNLYVLVVVYVSLERLAHLSLNNITCGRGGDAKRRGVPVY
jgi:hypothetical protein